MSRGLRVGDRVRVIQFCRVRDELGTVTKIEYDEWRTAHALVRLDSENRTYWFMAIHLELLEDDPGQG